MAEPRVTLRYMDRRGAGHCDRIPSADLPARLDALARRRIEATATADDGREVGWTWKLDGCWTWCCEKHEEAPEAGAAQGDAGGPER